jgi:aminopeptidase N
VKEDVWARIHEGGYPSLRLGIAAMGGFWQRHQRDLLEPFVPRFFEGLPGLFTEWEAEAARAYFNSFFPWYRIDTSTHTMVGAVLERGDLGPMLRRMLIEAGDDLERALACREFAGTAAPVAQAG